jgi:hypothetical protein
MQLSSEQLSFDNFIFEFNRGVKKKIQQGSSILQLIFNLSSAVQLPVYLKFFQVSFFSSLLLNYVKLLFTLVTLREIMTDASFHKNYLKVKLGQRLIEFLINQGQYLFMA